MHRALVPGSYDPVHNGHLEVIEKAAKLFDVVLVAAIHNPQKSTSLFTLEERRDMIEESTAHLPNVEFGFFSGLLVDFARDNSCDVIVKGLRAVSDFETELQMGQMNERLSGIVTMFLPTTSRHSFLASRLLREVAKFGGDISTLVPDSVNRRVKAKFA
jgi:pantetheine-phosphate adenylyltransferase